MAKPKSSEQSADKSTEMIRGTYIALRRCGRWEYVTRPNASAVVAVIALTPADELVLIEQYRPPVGARVLEIPAGLVGDEVASADESLLEAAHRELEEETGYLAGRWRQVAVGPPSAGLSDEVVTFFLARDLARSGSGGGVGDEAITVHYTTRDALGAFVAERAAHGCLIDPKVYTAAWFAWGDPAEDSRRNRTVP